MFIEMLFLLGMGQSYKNIIRQIYYHAVSDWKKTDTWLLKVNFNHVLNSSMEFITLEIFEENQVVYSIFGIL